MNNYILAVLITLLAGFSTLLGSLIMLFKRKINEKNITYILGFSISVILFLITFELIPETFNYIKENIISYLILPLLLLSILIGFLITNKFDKLLHHDEEENLYHVGLLATFAASLHKLPEAIVLFIVATTNIKLGILMALAILIHHIPEGIMISSSIYYETKSKLKAIKYTLISCLTNPVGIILSLLFSKFISNNLILGMLFGVSSGMFIFLLIKELIPSLLKYKEKKKAVTGLILGLIFIFIFHLILE